MSVWKVAQQLGSKIEEKDEIKIYNVIDDVCSGIIPEDKLRTITEMIALTAADVNKKAKKNRYYPVHQARIAFTGCAITNGRKAIQSFF